ncbi:hypothetical protein HanIR_Chr03g0118541 [Helianthus annuus]|nr:hypothetical protein HanIR_Chr03g0118541 [Helianthus annuus]
MLEHLQQGRFRVVLEERMRIFTDHTTREGGSVSVGLLKRTSKRWNCGDHPLTNLLFCF